jgi:hypothetical protein
MDPKESEPSYDLAYLHDPTEDGKGTKILRLRRGRVETAEVRPAHDGKPLNDQELVRLHPRKQTPRICDVEVLHEASAVGAENEQEKATSGPARVSSRAYRDNWDRVFAVESGETDDETGGDYSLN